MNEPPKQKSLSVEKYSENPLRYCIESDESLFWNGKEFVPKTQAKICLYDTPSAASKAIHRILVKLYTGKGTTRMRYTVPILIDVYGDPNLSEEEILDYLDEAMSFNIDTDKCGNGPHGNLVLPKVGWEHFRKLRKKK